MYLTREVYKQVIKSFNNRQVEVGGILGAHNGYIIDTFCFDRTGVGTKNSYSPDVEALNQIILKEWSKCGIELVGIIHSHLNENGFLSCGDMFYGEQILKTIRHSECFYLPILTRCNSCVRIHGYKIFLDSNNRIRRRVEKVILV